MQLVGEEIPDIAHLYRKDHLAGSLLMKLQKSGINLLPEDTDIEEAELTLKDSEAEDRAIEDIALAVRGFFIKSSKWTSQVSDDKVVYYMRENLEYDLEFAEDQEKDWKSIFSWRNKCAIYKLKESDEVLKE